MARKFLVSLDLNKNELLNARLQNLSSDPSSPVAGQIYYNTQENVTKFYDGSQWVAGGSTKFGNTASRPAASKAGTLYIDTETSTIYLDNGTSWLQATVNASDVADAISAHNDLTTGVHGVSGNVVGTSDTQSLSNKTIDDRLYFGYDNSFASYIEGEIDGSGNLEIRGGNDLTLSTQNGDIVLNPDGSVDVNSSMYIQGTLTVDHVYGDSSLTLSNNSNASQIHINNDTDNIELLPGNSGKAFYGSAATAGNEIARLSDIQAASSGLSWKQSVNLLSTSNIADLTDVASLTIDGHLLDGDNIGYRVLLSGQTTDSENGIYEIVEGSGSNITFARTADADTFSEIIGAAVFVMEGNQYAATSWVQANHYLNDFTSQDWVQFSGQGTYIGSNSIQVDGNQVNAVVDSSRGLTIDGDGIYAKIGDGIQFDGSGNISLSAGTGFTTASGTLEFASTYGVRKYTATIGNGSATSISIEHGFGTRLVTVQIFESSSPYAQVEADVEHTDTDTVTVKFASAPTTGEYEVVIVG